MKGGIAPGGLVAAAAPGATIDPPQAVDIRIEGGLRSSTRAHCGSPRSPPWSTKGKAASKVGGCHGPPGKGCAAIVQLSKRYNECIAPGRDIQVRRRGK